MVTLAPGPKLFSLLHFSYFCTTFWCTTLNRKERYVGAKNIHSIDKVRNRRNMTITAYYYWRTMQFKLTISQSVRLRECILYQNVVNIYITSRCVDGFPKLVVLCLVNHNGGNPRDVTEVTVILLARTRYHETASLPSIVFSHTCFDAVV